MSSAAYFRQKAEQCRQIAHAIVTSNGQAVASLQGLAAEFDSHAAAIEVEKAADTLIGCCDGFAPSGDGGRSYPEYKAALQ